MSSLWNHYIRISSGVAQCKYCKIQYNTKKTTSSLRYHIKNKHPEKCQPTTLIGEIDSDSQSEAENDPSTQENSNKRPRLSIPRKEYYSHRLYGLYDAVRNKLLSSLNQFPYVSITTDGWSSRANNSFVTITVHGIDDQWNLSSFTLDTLEMLESHNATNTYNHLAKTLNDWNLYDKVIAVVHDNARYMVATVRDNWEADDDIEISVRCFCHTLQCAVETALKECNLKDCLQRVSAIVGHFNKHSNKASTALENAQKKHHLPTHRLISHSPTRWNSAYDMVERLVEQRKAVECVLLDKEITTKKMMKKLLLNESDWTYLRDVIKIFKPFEVATRLMSSESQSTLSMVRPTVYSLLKKFLLQQDDDSENISLLKEILEKELTTRFLTNTNVTCCAIASYLNPRYKDLADEEESYRDKIKEKLKEMRERITVNEPDLSKNQRERDLDYLFDPVRGLSGNLQRMASLEGQSAIEKEMIKYEREPTIPKSDNPLLWWNSKRNKFPILANFARKFLCIPPSSTLSERVFSTAGNIISAKRSCLSPETANLLIFLYQNRDMIEKLD
ncbi:Similar to ZBED1: E3 SUMO-protein ligase ZBED1 (Homo sapiens) [Cotesia congregata]|uniref:Similar to ZBED1: E3 SUMO-protein ligase ZBED1 (Homo sapiens) n=1 Tax=Cotesia congregata TaxID=51543 RepID=A0A8J2MNH3_COTCN|nr:Similar to ZBED1: E3 SUMO-protein ligase ZBED1 (Homo sapiens) [Cotesia congregata]